MRLRKQLVVVLFFSLAVGAVMVPVQQCNAVCYRLIPQSCSNPAFDSPCSNTACTVTGTWYNPETGENEQVMFCGRQMGHRSSSSTFYVGGGYYPGAPTNPPSPHYPTGTGYAPDYSAPWTYCSEDQGCYQNTPCVNCSGGFWIFNLNSSQINDKVTGTACPFG